MHGRFFDLRESLQFYVEKDIFGLRDHTLRFNEEERTATIPLLIEGEIRRKRWVWWEFIHKNGLL
jgi:hypothetical protein